MGAVSGFLRWVEQLMGIHTESRRIIDNLIAAKTPIELETVWDGLTPEEKAMRGVGLQHGFLKKRFGAADLVAGDPIERLVSEALDKWLQVLEGYKDLDPEHAKKNLDRITADVMKLTAAVSGAELLLGKTPAADAQILEGISHRTLTWLGFGAVVAAAAHDPVKIGILRPYQDSLEQTFRNKRPDDNMLFQAYRTRELSPEKVADVDQITDADMLRIEEDNDKTFFREMSRHGYDDWYIRSLSFSATYTPRFNDLMQLGRQGLLTRGLAIYSLWGSGYDKLVMKPMLEALMEQNRRGSYEGFRSMIEPAYREGVLDEEDLTAYWTRIGVPAEVQGWVLPRLRKQRQAYKQKQEQAEQQVERDLTMSQVQQAYQYELLPRGEAQNMLLALGYSLDSAKILLDLADLRRKAPVTEGRKRLPLSDYEKAAKHKLISQAEVLGRMKGEYTERDIEIEKMMLEAKVE